MKKSTKFSDILHVLLHMSESDTPTTSESLAKAMSTNPVVVRRTMAGLRVRGFVTSEKGHGGGWLLSCDLKKVTLYDIYEAVGTPAMFAVGNRTDSPECLIEKAVHKATTNAFRDAENILITKLKSTTLANVRRLIKK